MDKWLGRVGLTVMLAVVILGCAGMYATWRDCAANGGTTVRGLFWLECIK